MLGGRLRRGRGWVGIWCGVSVMGGVAVARRWHARCHVQRVCQARSDRIAIRRRYSGLATRPRLRWLSPPPTER